ncbi:MAG TPA: acetyl-CoA carboxylase biotin carboxylase subunit [Desulfomonilaceae bacterium]|nr:acetyl-CoA carboxylase biotin carboxylase subunit [Desulfomonilaceae bacterium]
MFHKILIANRGEIAVRIIGTCKRMGIKTVAVYSEADFRSPYVELADESAFIGAAPARESFLDQEKIVEMALKHGCGAVHPGYGFLSENPDFARMVHNAGLVFIGPPVSAITALGDKMASKELAIRAGIPVVPGHSTPMCDLESVVGIAERVGFPLLLKPAAGGGGRGMRVVASEEELPAALEACREETRKSFGDDRIFMERYITKPRHVEIQILADDYGNVIHLGERECSIQRRYQKVIEETPSVAVSHELRSKMGDVACVLAKAARYVNAGTVEFIVDQDQNFYFLEMNTRLQVEHPVTELVTDLDLVEHQIKIAAGERLALRQEDVCFKGWAIEARICAEDPYRGFLPTTGMITRYAEPRGKHIRVDSGIAAGSLITIYYDSLLAKVVVWGKHREEAVANLVRALNGYHIEGLTTNVDFCNAIVNHPAFIRGDLSTDFIDEHFVDGESKEPPAVEHMHCMVIAACLVFHTRRALVKRSLKPMSPLVGGTPAPQRIHDYVVRVNATVFKAQLDGDQGGRRWIVTVDDKPYEVLTPEFEYYRRRLNLKINGQSHMFRLQYQDHHIKAFFCGILGIFEVYTPREWELNRFMLADKKVVPENVLKCPMPGLITAICVDKDAYVRRGQELVRMESMKMESGVASPCDGQVEKILVQPGQAVETDEVLMTFKL